ncbi:hypothetical protein [Lysinibacillus cavernae]|uniref:hypothetical protein n=1 Tax=Lysinibacillus cavernae TaxID=2666135 RepID=UPI001E311CDE|nr:hypothetical protein [Lysinibacillus cavernae]
MYNGVSYDFFDSKSDKICFMFSGTGYNYEKLILYYARSLMLELGFAVIQINYTFEQHQFEQEPQAISKMVYSVVDPLVAHIIQSKSYSKVIYLGKSLGTLPIIDFYMQKASAFSTCYVLFTPLLSLEHTMTNLLDKQAFLAIGTADPHYSQEKVAQLTTLDLVVYENLDHSLEVASNVALSIQFCQSLMTQLKVFLQNN